MAYNLKPRGSTPQAQPLLRKALEIRRRLLTDDHPDTADKLQQPGDQPHRAGEVRRRPSRSTRRRWRSAAACSPTTTPKPPAATTTWRSTSTPRGSTPQAQPLLREGAGDPPATAHRRPPRHRRQLQQPGGQPQRPGEVRPGPATLREGTGDPPPPAYRRSPRNRRRATTTWR